MKNVKEFLVEKINAESPAFIKVLEAVPEDKLDWKPDPKSKTARELAGQIADEIGQIADIISTGAFDLNDQTFKHYTSVADMVAAFTAGAEKTKAALSAASDSDWDADATLTM